tara:strand:- start:441 stop:764 length:324 start_codon:yes stop_codon:yes gene_type:complete
MGEENYSDLTNKDLYNIPNGCTVRTTNYGGSSIKATYHRDGDTKWSKIIARDYRLSGVTAHAKAVIALMNSDKWFGHKEDPNDWRIVSWGHDYGCHTFVVSREVTHG